MENLDNKNSDGSVDKELQADFRTVLYAIWKKKTFVCLATMVCSVSSLVIALTIPNVYESKALLAPKLSGGASGLTGLASQYGGLASLAGINIGGISEENNKTQIAINTIKSFDFFVYIYIKRYCQS